MIDVEIGISEEQMNRINAILCGEHRIGGLSLALARPVLNMMRSEVPKKISEVYAIKPKDVRAESTIKVSRYGLIDENGIVGYISFSGKLIPLHRFNVSPKLPGTGETVRAAVLRSSTPTPFKRAFIAQMKSGHYGVFERIPGKYMRSRKGANKHAEKIGAIVHGKEYSQFYGPSVAHMAGNAVTIEEIERATNEVIEKNLDAEIDRILSGY